MPSYSPRFESALAMAARAHARQHRKGTDVPYVTHLVHVAWMLARHGFDEDVVIAGLLHDLLEDTVVGERQIRDAFGEGVARIVRECTEPDHDYAMWEERKEHTIEHLRTAGEDVRAVVCADKLHNLATIRDELRERGDEVWRKFGRGVGPQAWYYREIAASLSEGWSHPMLDELRALVAEVFGA